MRAFWTGSITFGLVNIPIRLYSAVDGEAIHFHLLDRKNVAPVHYQRVSEADGRVVPYQEIVKGYEYEKGSFIIMEDKDFQKAAPEKPQL